MSLRNAFTSFGSSAWRGKEWSLLASYIYPSITSHYQQTRKRHLRRRKRKADPIPLNSTLLEAASRTHS
jgi:hypothetical protein